jgi:hypothetical protein
MPVNGQIVHGVRGSKKALCNAHFMDCCHIVAEATADFMYANFFRAAPLPLDMIFGKAKPR